MIGQIKGYVMITNVEFTIRKVAYGEGLQYNLISVSQLVVGIGLEILFDKEGLEITDKESEKVIFKYKRKGEMYPLNMKLIKGKPSICLLAKASS